MTLNIATNFIHGKKEHIQVGPLLVYNAIPEEKPARVANKKFKIVITLPGDKKRCFYELLPFSFEITTNIRKNTLLLSPVRKRRRHVSCNSW
jgi:hypothetical protein